MVFAIMSPSFADQAEIPIQYTCEGKDIAPPLAWTDVPAGTKSLAIIVDDPDAPDPRAPRMTWAHWVVLDIPRTATGLPEGGALPPGSRAGKNDWKRTAYNGPCPPIGRHRYFFKLYALDTGFPELMAPTKAELEAVMRGHVVGHAQLVGMYEKKR